MEKQEMTEAETEKAELGHDGLILWQPFKEYAEGLRWLLNTMSPNELDEAYELFKAGFNTAKTYFQGQWVAIRTEADLPKESGEYLVTMHTPSTDRHITTLRFWDFVLEIQDEEKRHRRLKLDNWMPYRDGNYAIAWMPLPEPFIPQEKP